jgi:hypothetical protein
MSFNKVVLKLNLREEVLFTKDTTRRPRRRWVDNVKIDLRQTGWGGMGWIDLAQDRDQCRALLNSV